MRVISLVPSLTEAVAVTVPGALVGVTDWCSHPADLGDDVVCVGGTKNPKVEQIVALAPDLVVANEEENREPDLAALREAGIEVLLTEVRDVPQAFRELERVVTACGAASRPRWLDEAETAWSAPERWWSTATDLRTTAVVPIWRRPWMVCGRDTFAGDVLARLGVDNVYASHAERYPRVPIEELRAAARPGIVVLPDEPYRFTAEDGPEAFDGVPYALVSGRHLTWYGPSLAEAPRVLGEALRAAHR
ncbi:helical backbone metal receptor [Streptomyces sp. ME02-8801-2C]|uniref:helical backbone metal receptor n=1 Tax=Streptomyces sp. ME02-8801-2C TaxID=3028680 RepID=UPI0029A89FB6|nr:helical backbone metal receptor [Streptomyces sp. ME02-8801-2C]MDX3454998.1 helical backbone metal receptor [Streptomyces sp. ME02-8801-2C]